MAQHSILNSQFPVVVPHFSELLLTDSEFVRRLEFVDKKLQQRKRDNGHDEISEKAEASEKDQVEESPFMKALLVSDARFHTTKTLATENLTLTNNGDVAHLSSQDALVDLFFGLTEDDADEEQLQNAWNHDPQATLKILFNARSVHLGKSSRIAAYKSMGWLYKEHPLTFLVNLPWIVRPVITKPRPKKDETTAAEGTRSSMEGKAEAENDDDDFELVVPPEGAAFDSVAFDRTNGLAHGYWKDLLNMLALASHDHLAHDKDPKVILNIEQNNKGQRTSSRAKGKRKLQPDADAEYPWEVEPRRVWDRWEAQDIRREARKQHYDVVTHKLKSHVVYQLFHVALARLFASQLKRDLALLKSKDVKDQSRISLVAKWAPSPKGFHDKNTWIASSIAEILFSHDQVCPAGTPKSDRETYLKYARMDYQNKVLSPLRKALDVVERKVSAKEFDEIDYAKVPSLAMQRYSKLFQKESPAQFTKYLNLVTAGKAKISGAVLLPSVMVSNVDNREWTKKGPQPDDDTVARHRVLDLQWNSLVQRIKDSGKIEASIAVCDVSDSMTWLKRSDGTTPMHSSIGLSLLLAEVCAPPFGGSMITFAEKPSVVKVGGVSDKRDFTKKVKHVMRSPWGGSTNFEAVFSDLILPIAIENKIAPQDMVKQIFVFSDMQFNAAMGSPKRWTSSYERIKEQYKGAGYEMPTLIFWNLAGGKKKGVPVEAGEPGTALVSGYSQGQMKMFMEGGSFDDVEEAGAEDDEVLIDDDGEEIKIKKEKRKIDSVQTMRKAISHPAYAMLRVVD